MRTIATEYRGYGEGSYTIKLVTNNKENSNGIYVITGPKGYEHEAGIWERIKDKNNYIYCGLSFAELSNDVRRKRYYKRIDMMENKLFRFIKENENRY